MSTWTPDRALSYVRRFTGLTLYERVTLFECLTTEPKQVESTATQQAVNPNKEEAR